MSHNQAPQAHLSIVARFPRKYFLENLVVRVDGSFLITVVTNKELWFVPTPRDIEEVVPIRIHTFEEIPTGIIEIEPDVFLIFCSNLYTTHESFAYQLDLRDWQPGSPIEPKLLCQFPEPARGLNGCRLIAPGVILIADCFASLIWRFELKEGASTPLLRVWMEHESMSYYPGKMKPEQPGVNGVRYAAKTGHLYYTSTAKKLFMRVKVDPETYDPTGEPELIVAGRMGDDFCIDEEAGVIYLTTHRQNTIDIISMDPGLNSGFTQSVAGEPYTNNLIGPSSGVWSRNPGDYGRIAYFIMDGGTASPPPDGPQEAQLLRVEFQPLLQKFPGSGS